jgi:HlyD family secretion protein
VVRGRGARVDPRAENGPVAVDIALEEALPRGARPDLSVDGTVELERLENVLYVGRPAFGQAESTVSLFRLTTGGDTAERVAVKLGRGSVHVVEVAEGLNEGDRVVLSDLSTWDAYDRIRLR